MESVLNWFATTLNLALAVYCLLLTRRFRKALRDRYLSAGARLEELHKELIELQEQLETSCHSSLRLRQEQTPEEAHSKNGRESSLDALEQSRELSEGMY
jgi:hypothetical protein